MIQLDLKSVLLAQFMKALREAVLIYKSNVGKKMFVLKGPLLSILRRWPNGKN